MKKVWILVLIVLLGLVLRVNELGEESLWVDEAFSVDYGLSSDVVNSIVLTEGAPPGHYLMLHYWISIFGSSTTSVRIPSLIFGVLAILIMFLIGKELFNVKVGILSSLLLSTSMLQILFSQEARLYALYGFLVLLAGYFFILIIKKNKWWCYLGYALTVVLAVYTNYLALSLIVLFTLAGLWYWEKFSIGKWFLTNGLICCLCLPLLPVLLLQYSIASPGVQAALLRKGLPQFFVNFGLFFYTIPLALLMLLGTSIVLMKKKVLKLFSFGDIPFTALIVVFSTIYVYLVLNPVSMFGMTITRFPITHSYFLIRHSYFLVPVLYLFVAYKLSFMKKFAAFCLGLLLITNMFSLFVYYETPTKGEWQEAVQYVEMFPKQPVLMDSGGYSAMFLTDYYGDFPKLRLTWINKHTREIEYADDDVLLKYLNEKEEFIFFLTNSNKKGEHYRKLFDTNFELESVGEFYKITVYHYVS